jgi:hypothetical protein
LFLNCRPVRQFVEILAGSLILRVRPRLHPWVVIFFKPLIRIFDSYVLVFGGDRFLWSLWRWFDRAQIAQGKSTNHTNYKWEAIGYHAQ